MESSNRKKNNFQQNVHNYKVNKIYIIIGEKSNNKNNRCEKRQWEHVLVLVICSFRLNSDVK